MKIKLIGWPEVALTAAIILALIFFGPMDYDDIANIISTIIGGN